MRRIWLSDAAKHTGSVELVAELAPSRSVRVPKVPIFYSDAGKVIEQNLRYLFERPFTTIEPAVAVYRVRDAIMLSNTVVFTSDGWVINDTFGPYYNPVDVNAEYSAGPGSTGVTISSNNDVSVQLSSLRAEYGSYFSLRDRGEAGYFHFLNSVLPRARIWQRQFPGMDAYYAEDTPFQVGFYDLASRPDRTSMLKADRSSVFFRELFLVGGLVRPDGFSGGFFERPRLVIEHLLGMSARIPPGTVERVYVSRRDSDARAVEGEREFEEMLTSQWGFTPALLSEMSPSEQISLFKGAQVVMGLHGAGLSNIAFCAPGTQVLEVFSPTRIWPTFRALAARCDHRYAAVVMGASDRIRFTDVDAFLQTILRP